jgi:hypothetical protein
LAKFKVDQGWQSKDINTCEALWTIQQQKRSVQLRMHRDASVASSSTQPASDLYYGQGGGLPPPAGSYLPGMAQTAYYGEPTYDSFSAWPLQDEYGNPLPPPPPPPHQQGSSKDHPYPVGSTDSYMNLQSHASQNGAYFPTTSTYDPYAGAPSFQPPAHRKLSRPTQDSAFSSSLAPRHSAHMSDFLKTHPHVSNAHLPLSQPPVGDQQVTFAELDDYYSTPQHPPQHRQQPGDYEMGEADAEGEDDFS